MNYIDQLMGAQERPVFITRKHWSVVLRKSIRLVFTTFLLLVLYFVFTYILRTNMQIPEGLVRATPFISIAFGILILLNVIGLGVDIARWQNQVYIITNWRVIQVFGVLNKTSIDSALEKVNDVKLEQTWLGRILNYGDLEIVTGSDVGINRLDDIAYPILFKTTLINQKERNDARFVSSFQPQPLPQQGTLDIPALIDKLRELRDAGALTEDEYQSKKTDLLKRL